MRHLSIVVARIFAALLVLGAATLLTGGSAGASTAKINGGGSTYVALAMQQWVADAQTNGLEINYLPTGSPQGLQQFGQSLIDFAGTEAEFSALQATGGEAVRGFQYVPDVAGAVSIMYNVQDKAGRSVNYLHLSRRTVALIFIGEITNWDDPAISADNKGLQLPDHDITVVYRAGQSGTTGLFYDFVANTAPDRFGPWAARNQLPTDVHIIQLDSSPQFAPKTEALNGSDQIAQHIGSGDGLWSIGYDEFGYAKTYNVNAAWIQNASGSWVQPYAQNISAALVGAKLHADLSQDLTGVYASGDPAAYPISAYSYLVTQCQGSDRPTCKGPYLNGGVTETLTKWMRYIACGGQSNMAQIGYSPLPSNLSQEIANSIGRMTGQPAEQLTAGNCNNPRFSGSLGAGATSPPDPLANVQTLAPGGSTHTSAGGGSTAGAGSTAAKTGTGAGTSGAGTAAGGATATGADPSGTVPGAAAAADGSAIGPGGVTAAGGGSASWRDALPVVYDRPVLDSPTLFPVLVLLVVLSLPLIIGSIWRRVRGTA